MLVSSGVIELNLPMEGLLFRDDFYEALARKLFASKKKAPCPTSEVKQEAK